ncbi:amidohydrolase family protein [Lentzea alba]|uniref:amidohydrolase n=1 Tax=Lentzea alba TaxID=2714351 RepID=UPI0039BFEE17
MNGTLPLTAALLGCLTVLGAPPDAISPAAPDTIYHHGVVLTMNATQPRAEAIAILRDRIVAVGDDETVLSLASRTTRLINLNGHTVMPGFIDSHAHWIGDGEMIGYTAEQAVSAALTRGWTSINEQFVDIERFGNLRSLDRAGALRLRVNAYLPVNYGDEKFGGWYLGIQPRQSYSPHLRVAGIKLFLDHDWGTTFHWNQAELNDYVGVAHRNGWQISAHVVSAEAHDQYLTAITEALKAHPNPDARHRVEHVIQLRDDQLARMRELGLIASIQPGLPGESAKEAGFPALVARGEPGWIARWQDLLDEGVRTIGSTDMPWLVLVHGGHATDMPHGTPLEAVHQAVGHGLTVEQALRMFTVDAAYGTFEEDVKGSLAPNKYADFVILSDDPTSATDLPSIETLATVVGGRSEHCADRVRDANMCS